MSFLVNMENEKVKELFSLMNDFNKDVLMLNVILSQGKTPIREKISELQNQKDRIHITGLRFMQQFDIFKEYTE